MRGLMLRYRLMKSLEILRKFSLVPSPKTRSCSSKARVFIHSIRFDHVAVYNRLLEISAPIEVECNDYFSFGGKKINTRLACICYQSDFLI